MDDWLQAGGAAPTQVDAPGGGLFVSEDGREVDQEDRQAAGDLLSLAGESVAEGDAVAIDVGTRLQELR